MTNEKNRASNVGEAEWPNEKVMRGESHRFLFRSWLCNLSVV